MKHKPDALEPTMGQRQAYPGSGEFVARTLRRIVLPLMVATGMLVLPAAVMAQEGNEYPPAPPPTEASIGVEVQGRAEAKVIIATGEGLEPDTVLEVDVTLGGPPGEAGSTEEPENDAAAGTNQHSTSATVEDDGSATAELELPCDEDRRANIRASGTPDSDIDDRGRVVATETVDLSSEECTGDPAAVLSGTETATASDGNSSDQNASQNASGNGDPSTDNDSGINPSGSSNSASGIVSLASTGTGIAVLLASATALLCLGSFVLRRTSRRRSTG